MVVVKTLPAGAGFTWLRDALTLYRRQPFAFTALVILYTMTISLLAYLPVIGLPLAAVLIPFGTIGLTVAGREAERNKMPMPGVMVQPFRDAQQRKALARLGFVNAALMLTLVLLVWLFAADDLANWDIIEGKVDAASARQNFPWDAIAVAGVLYVPILMATWFAPYLVAWHGYSIAKAMFFSFFACWRNRWPFLALAAAMAALFVAVIFLSTQLLQLLGVSPELASMLFAPVLLVLVSIGYATQYPIYRSLIE